MSEYHGHEPGSVELITNSKELQEELQRSFDDRCTVRINGLEFVCTQHNCDNKFRLQEFSRVMPAKPGPAKKEWTGEGLPPVGTVCELRARGGGWGKAEIKYHGRAVCVWLWSRDDGNIEQVEHALCPDHMDFRPIRTPEQIAAEVRSKAIDAMCCLTLEKITVHSAGLLYDAGYRKSEIVDE